MRLVKFIIKIIYNFPSLLKIWCLPVIVTAIVVTIISSIIYSLINITIHKYIFLVKYIMIVFIDF